MQNDIGKDQVPKESKGVCWFCWRKNSQIEKRYQFVETWKHKWKRLRRINRFNFRKMALGSLLQRGSPDKYLSLKSAIGWKIPSPPTLRLQFTRGYNPQKTRRWRDKSNKEGRVRRNTKKRQEIERIVQENKQMIFININSWFDQLQLQ